MHIHRKNAVKILKYTADVILPLIFWLSVTFGFDAPCFAILTVVCAIIHECAHLFALSVYNKTFCAPTPRLNGFAIRVTRHPSYIASMAVSLAGPVSNLVVFFLSIPFSSLLNGYFGLFGIISLLTGISNLMPIEGYDGYNFLKDLFSYKEMYGAIRSLEKLSVIICTCAVVLSLYLLLRVGGGYWIFAIFFTTLIRKTSANNCTNNN